MRMYDGMLILTATNVPEPLSQGIGDRIKDQPMRGANLVITALPGNVASAVYLGGQFVEVGGGTPLRPGEQDPRVFSFVDLNEIYLVGNSADGVSFSYTDVQLASDGPVAVKSAAGASPLFN